MRPTNEQIEERMLDSRKLRAEVGLKDYDTEVWNCEYKVNAYTDNLGIERDAYVVHKQKVLHVFGTYDQYEGYGDKWYTNVGALARDDDGNLWVGYTNLVDYWGGMSWYQEENAPEHKVYWRRPPWIDPKLGFAKGYMMPDGTPAKPLLGDNS